MKPNQDLIGKYLNYYGYTDIYPQGVIVDVKGKSTLILKKVEASENKTQMNFEVGGFSAICTNQFAQSYDFTVTEETFEVRLSNKLLKTSKIENEPRKYYDYNF